MHDIDINKPAVSGNVTNFILSLIAITVGAFMLVLVILAIDYNEFRDAVKTVKENDDLVVNLEILPDIEKLPSNIETITSIRALDHAHLHFRAGIEWLMGYTNFVKISLINSKVYDKDNNYMDLGTFRKYVFYCYLAVLSMYILLYLSFVSRYKINREKALRESRTMIENKTHMNLTESLHHELNMPMAILSDGLKDLKELSLDHIKDLSYGNVKCSDIILNMERAIDQINGTLGYLSKTKQIRYSNGNVSVLDILENVESNVNRFAKSKVTMKISKCTDRKMLASISTSVHDFGNSSMLNILNVMINNSIEARANLIEFKVVDKTRRHITLHIKDNGIGIQDEFGNVCKNNNIFKYGYSTKDIEGAVVTREKTFYSMFLKFLGLDVSKGDKSRGSGLYISNQILYKTGGSIWIHETSPKGTTMAIKFPYKSLHKG